MATIDKEEKYIKIAKNDFVTVTEMNHIYEVQYMEKSNNRQIIQKINSNEYVVLDTGELKEFNKTENRSENYSSLKKTFKKIRYLINNNFVGARNELFITLTYKENMTDTNRLYDDFRKFIQRLRYAKRDLGGLEYLDIIEPQARGAWHHHVLIKFPEEEEIFIENKELSKIWGHGFVRVNRIQNVDNIGAYLTAYLADIEIGQIENAKGDIVEKDTVDGKKKFIKGGRLGLYPTGTNLYRKSKGIRFPERRKMRYSKALELIGEATKTMETNVFLENEEYENHLKFEQYNKRRD